MKTQWAEAAAAMSVYTGFTEPFPQALFKHCLSFVQGIVLEGTR